MTLELDPLDQLASKAFESFVVRKDLVRSFAGQYSVPTYVVEFLLGKYCATTDPDGLMFRKSRVFCRPSSGSEHGGCRQSDNARPNHRTYLASFVSRTL